MIIGHSRQIEYLDKVLKRGSLAHAYLFYGPARVGKFTVAKFFAEKLGCTDPVVLDIEHTLISKKEERKNIPIEDIWELKRQFSYASAGDQWRVAIINEAEKMSEEAANAFLKLLEEPGERTLFLLVSEFPDFMPSTVVSRCQPIRFSLVSEKEIELYLKNSVKDESVSKEILSYSVGRPGIAIELSGNPELLEKERKFRKMFNAAISGEIHDVFEFTAKAASDAGLRIKTAEYLTRHMREEILKNSGAAENPVRRIKKINEIFTALETTNVNPRLALDVMFLEACSR